MIFTSKRFRTLSGNGGVLLLLILFICLSETALAVEGLFDQDTSTIPLHYRDWETVKVEIGRAHV